MAARIIPTATLMDTLRLLIDPALDGVTNMARDEALLTSVGEGLSPPTLRFYRWDPPTISLGYFQPYAEYEALPPPAGQLAVVRRTTGGGAILHDREWTYSLTLPSTHRLLQAGPARLYELIHDALIDALSLLRVPAGRCGRTDDSSARHGPFFCFDRRHCTDVLLAGRKLAGSAQRRTRHAILQHGSIILANRFPQHAAAALGEQLNLADEDLLAPFCEAIEHRLTLKLDRGEWRGEELDVAGTLGVKYASEDWTKKFA